MKVSCHAELQGWQLPHRPRENNCGTDTTSLFFHLIFETLISGKLGYTENQIIKQINKIYINISWN